MCVNVQASVVSKLRASITEMQARLSQLVAESEAQQQQVNIP